MPHHVVICREADPRSEWRERERSSEKEGGEAHAEPRVPTPHDDHTIKRSAVSISKEKWTGSVLCSSSPDKEVLNPQFSDRYGLDRVKARVVVGIEDGSQK